jgi:O-antigen/teichoic acid export membrane protein
MSLGPTEVSTQELASGDAPRISAIPSLTVSFIWTLAGSISYSGSQWAMIVLFAKLGNPAMVGQYAFAAAVAYPVSLVANLQLRAVFVNDRAGRYPFRRMLGARYLLTAVAWMVLPFICLCMRATGQTTGLILLVGTGMLIDSLSESYYSLLQKCERMDRVGRSQIFKGALCLALATGALYLTHSVLYAVCGVLFGRLLVLMFYDTGRETFEIGRISSEIKGEPSTSGSFLRRFPAQWDLKLQWEMIWIALPLGAVSVIASFNLGIPRYVIEHYLGTRELGIYSALSYLPYAAVLFSSALGYVGYARLGKLYFDRDIRGFRLLLGRMVAIAAGIGILGLILSTFAGKPILRLLYRPEYAEQSNLLLWLVGAAGLACVSSCVGVAMTAASQFRPQIPLALVVGMVSAIGALALVPRMGLYGAAIATIVSLSIQIAGTYWLVDRALRRRVLVANEFGGGSSIVEDALTS